MMVKDNLILAEQKISEACKRSGRDRSEVKLIAVSKTKPVEMVQEAYDLGIRDFGENKVKEMLGKEPLLPEDICWHMIGHLQTNKVKDIIGKTVLIHSIDSIKLSDTIDFAARKAKQTVNGLLEVNISGEETKFGFSPEELFSVLDRLKQYRNLKICGLMTVAAPIQNDPEENRPVFRRLKQLSIDIKQKNVDNVSMNILSMGMSDDYCVAVEEGATCVRIGTGIFGVREGRE